MRDIEPITVNEVRLCYGDDAVEEAYVQQAINTAATLMRRIPDTLPDDNYRVVHIYLAAHFLAISLPRLTSEAGGGISASYELPSLGEGLKASVYGAQAVMLDTTDTLERLSTQRISITFAAIGIQPCRFPTGGQPSMRFIKVNGMYMSMRGGWQKATTAKGNGISSVDVSRINDVVRATLENDVPLQDGWPNIVRAKDKLQRAIASVYDAPSDVFLTIEERRKYLEVRAYWKDGREYVANFINTYWE